MLSAFNISKAYLTRTLFSGLTLNVDAGDRIALIGANGSGKTTLMDVEDVGSRLKRLQIH